MNSLPDGFLDGFLLFDFSKAACFLSLLLSSVISLLSLTSFSTEEGGLSSGVALAPVSIVISEKCGSKLLAERRNDQHVANELQVDEPSAPRGEFEI